MKRNAMLALALVLTPPAIYAHNGMEHVMGAVTAITETSITVKTTDGKTKIVALAGTTKYLKGTTTVALKDIKVGDHIVIHATKKDNQLTAAEVKVGAMGSMKGMSGMDMSGGKSSPK